MIADKAKRRAAGRVKWAINKLLAHADMAVKVPKAALSQVLPSAQQCCRLAEGLGAALVELERAPDAAKTAFAAAPGSGALTWSAEKPKRPGWWWLSDADFEGPTVRRVVERSGKLRVWLPLDQVWMAVDGTPPKWRWAGPLVEPVGTPDVEPPLNIVLSNQESDK